MDLTSSKPGEIAFRIWQVYLLLQDAQTQIDDKPMDAKAFLEAAGVTGKYHDQPQMLDSLNGTQLDNLITACSITTNFSGHFKQVVDKICDRFNVNPFWLLYGIGHWKRDDIYANMKWSEQNSYSFPGADRMFPEPYELVN